MLTDRKTRVKDSYRAMLQVTEPSVMDVTEYDRKAMIRPLRRPSLTGRGRRRGRRVRYAPTVIRVEAIWTAAGYPWSVWLRR